MRQGTLRNRRAGRRRTPTQNIIANRQFYPRLRLLANLWQVRVEKVLRTHGASGLCSLPDINKHLRKAVTLHGAPGASPQVLVKVHTVPIRLSPTPTTSRVLPIARVKLGVSGSGDIASNLGGTGRAIREKSLELRK